MPSSSHPIWPDLHELVGLFYSSPEDLGQFTEVLAEEIPQPSRQLLAHEHHMTVTVEKFHNSTVDVHVLDKQTIDTHYSRKILLSRQSDDQVVQFGIMRVNFAYLSPEVQHEIQQERLPLGRILIQHDVLRRVRLSSLWRVTPGEDLRRLFAFTDAAEVYGRTAIMECNHEPAIELLEIVTPA